VKALARCGAPVTSAAAARLAAVSRSFIYENDKARALITSAQARSQALAAGRIPAATAQQEASWRERALNAEERARQLQHELTAQRRITAGYLGQLARDRNDLQRKLEAARANLARLTERQVSDLFPRGPGKQAEGRALQTASAAAGNVCLVRVYPVGGILSRCPPPTLTPPLCRRLALMAQRADLADRRRAVGDRDRQIGEPPGPGHAAGRSPAGPARPTAAPVIRTRSASIRVAANPACDTTP
jgi:hypothetical protein